MNKELEEIREAIVGTDAVIEDENPLELDDKGVEVPEAVAEAEVEPEPEVVTEEEEAAPDPEEDEKVSKTIMLKRIAKEKAKTEAALAEAKALREAAGPKKETYTEEEVEAKSRVDAVRIANQMAFDAACNNLAKAAAKENPKFNESYTEMLENVEPRPEAVRDVLEDVLNLENGHTVLNHLTKDIDEAERVFALAPRARTIELAKLSAKLAAPKPKPISKAPDPITPVGGNNRSPGTLTENQAMDEWMATRQKQIAENPRMRR